LSGEHFSVTQHGCRDVREENAQPRADAVYGSERDQAVSGANVGEYHAWGKPSGVEHAIRVSFNLGSDNLGERRIVGVAAMQQPLRPDIRLGFVRDVDHVVTIHGSCINGVRRSFHVLCTTK
jgi:hypothetical protein